MSFLKTLSTVYQLMVITGYVHSKANRHIPTDKVHELNKSLEIHSIPWKIYSLSK